MSPESIIADNKKYKYFTGLYTDEFEALFVFLESAKYELTYCDGPENTGKAALQEETHRLQL